jgi:hypothetical protein
MAMTVIVLSACSSPDDSEKQAAVRPTTPAQVEAKQREAERIIDQQMGKMQRKEASTWPCSLFPQPELETLVGNPLDKGSYAFNNVSENDHEYKSESCDWSGKGGSGNEVRLWVSLPKHFKSGRVECSPGSANQKISGVGEQAWWDYQKYWGGGTLRVCSPEAMLEVKVTVANKDEGTARKIAQTMATKVLESRSGM